MQLWGPLCYSVTGAEPRAYVGPNEWVLIVELQIYGSLWPDEPVGIQYKEKQQQGKRLTAMHESLNTD